MVPLSLQLSEFQIESAICSNLQLDAGGWACLVGDFGEEATESNLVLLGEAEGT